ncbi:MAG: phosphate ABC transporter permease PstA [Planctomycetes bacterium]|nr:phosphate ABC transporter permease PstA [Planctomycetota bacterium]MCB9887136.1 phosphate ABC transporter permease PstA [Planctomycetota bacterium]
MPVERPKLEHDLRAVRTLFDRLLTALCALLSLVAALPLFAVLWLLIERGATNFRLDMLWSLPPSGLDTTGGGFGNAILGTVYMVGIASVLAVPTGILAAIFLAEYGDGTRLAAVIRFAAKVLTGMPSILAGIFAYAMVVLATGHFSALAGGVALAVLMVPIVVLTAEQAIRAVPQKMKDAAVGMGATSAQVVMRVTLPTAMPSVLTGVMLAIARAAGETAPLLFTAQFSNYWLRLDRLEDTASLAVLIYQFSGSPYEHQIEMAWTAALVLVLLVLLFNIAGQVLAARSDHSRH